MKLLRSPVSLAFFFVHIACFAAMWTGVTNRALLTGIALYVFRIFAIGAGYHRYFAHRAFKTSRSMQFCLAFASQTSAQRGVLWWAAKHRHHHRYSDTERDVHSPDCHGFLHAHIGWVFAREHDETDYNVVRDLAQYAELRWLDRHIYLPTIMLAAVAWLIAGGPGLVVGYCWSTVAVWHVTFSVNSIGHIIGRQRYVTGDRSRNNWLLAIFTMGEGWHNNHHAYQASVRQGFRWWEYDLTFYVLRLLSWFGVVWNLRTPPADVLRCEQRLARDIVEKVARQLTASFPIERITDQVREALARTQSWGELRLCALRAHRQAEEFLDGIQLPQFPTLDEVRRYAEARLARTPSIDQIASRTRQCLLELVAARLIEKALA